MQKKPSEGFFKKDVMRNFLKNESLVQGFSWEICKICRNFFYAEHHRTVGSGHSSINSSKGRIGKLNHKL